MRESLRRTGMEPGLAHLEWTGPFWYRVLSYYFSLQTSDDRFANHLRTLLGVFEVARDSSEEPSPPTPGAPVRYRIADLGEDYSSRYRLYHNNDILAASERASFVLDQLLWHINAECARRTGDYVLVHSGVIATAAGVGVLLPGASGAGKSTLVAGLYRHGFTYYSDEAAAIDPIGRRLYPYPKAITLKDQTAFVEYPGMEAASMADQFVRGRRYIVPYVKGKDILTQHCTVGFIFVPKYAEGSVTEVRSITPAAAAMELGRNVINIGRYGARVLPLLSEIATGAQCYAIQSGSLREAVGVITDTIGE